MGKSHSRHRVCFVAVTTHPASALHEEVDGFAVSSSFTRFRVDQERPDFLRHLFEVPLVGLDVPSRHIGVQRSVAAFRPPQDFVPLRFWHDTGS